jgi:hypothetical protein
VSQPVADRVKVRVLRVVGVAYRDLAHVLKAMPRLVAIAVLIVLARALVELLLPDDTAVVGKLASFALQALESFLLTPFFIAVHRFIILDEITTGYVLDPNDPRFLRFFGWSLMFTAFDLGSALLQGLLMVVAVPTLTIIVTIVFGLAVVIAALRLTMLFPAIAVDAAGANAPNAFADTRGNAFRISVIFVLAFLPIGALSFALTPWDSLVGHALPPVNQVILAVVYAAALPLFIAVASRIFQALADHLVGRPIGGAVAPT